MHVSSRSPPIHAQPIVLGNAGRDGRSFWPKRSLSARQFGNSGSVTLLGQFPRRAKNRLQALVSAIIVHRMPTCGRTGLVDTCRIRLHPARAARRYGTRYAPRKIARTVWATLAYIRDNIMRTVFIDPANTNNRVSDDLTSGEKQALANAASIARQANNWGQIVA